MEYFDFVLFGDGNEMEHFIFGGQRLNSYWRENRFCMKIYCISDLQELEVGLKLSGCDGITCEKEEEIKNKIDEIVQNKEYGILVITDAIYKKAKDKIDKLRQTRKLPLITII